MTNDSNDLSKHNLDNEKTNGSNNEPIRNPILSQSVNNANISTNASNGSMGGEVNQILPGMENFSQNNTNAGMNNNKQLPEMQNFSNQNSLDNNGQSVFLDQQGFDQMSYGDQTAYNQGQMNINPLEQGGNNQSQNMYEQNGYNQSQNTYEQNGYNQNQNMYEQNEYNHNQNMYQNGYEQGQYTKQNNSYFEEANSQYGSQSSQDDSDYNLAFVQNWMGNIYEKAHSKKFNWPAALLGEAYLLYRKVYIPGMIFLVLTLLLLVVTSITGNAILEIILGVYVIARFFGLGFGFYPMYRSNVRKELNKYKSQIQDNNDLINKAKKNGGTSVISLVACLVIELIVSGIGMSMALKNTPGANNKNNNGNNSANEVTTNSQEVFFETGYVITYDSNKWFYTPANSTFTQGDYKLKYKVKYNEQQLGVDFTTAEGRSALLSMLTNSFNAQAAQSNLQAEVANSTFIAKFTSYYAYIDIISSTAISRYYFVILPSEKVMFQFVLEVNDTAIDYTTNLDVIDMISLITPANEDAETKNTNSTANETATGNNVAGNMVSNEVSNGTLSSTTNEVSGDVRNALSSDNVSSQRGNTTSSSNANTSSTSSSNAIASSSSTGNAIRANSSSSLSSLVQ